MSIQFILTLVIIAVAAGIGIYRTYRSLRNPSGGCDGCEKSCGDCSLEELKREIAIKRRAGRG
jgi:hypothetical protein